MNHCRILLHIYDFEVPLSMLTQVSMLNEIASFLDSDMVRGT
jgi:hypothetical protein